MENCIRYVRTFYNLKSTVYMKNNMTEFYFIIFQINMNFDVLVFSVIVLVSF